MSGIVPSELPVVYAKSLGSIKLDPDRPEFHRGIVDFHQDGFVVRGTGNQISSRLMSMKTANALIELPAGKGTIENGEMVKCRLIRCLI